MESNNDKKDSKENIYFEEMKEFFNKMGDCFTNSFDNEKMEEMMKKFKEKMKKGKEYMMGMMDKMKDSMSEDDNEFPPFKWFKVMMDNFKENSNFSNLATPEIQALFEDWLNQIEEEIIDFVKDKNSIDVKEIADKFKISEKSAYYFLTRMAQKGKIKINIIYNENKENNA